MDFEQFAAERSTDLLRFARALTGDRGLAEDLVQDALLKLYLRPGQLDDLSNPDGYARHMVTNSYVSWGRRWFRVRPTATMGERTQSDHAETLADRDELRGQLYQLPRRQRAVLVLRYYAGLSDAEIAAELGCSSGTVRSHASRALAVLRVRIGDEQSQPEEICR